MAVEKLVVGDAALFDSLTEHDKEELRKFDRYLRVLSEPEQPIEGAYANVYGEVKGWRR